MPLKIEVIKYGSFATLYKMQKCQKLDLNKQLKYLCTYRSQIRNG